MIFGTVRCKEGRDLLLIAPSNRSHQEARKLLWRRVDRAGNDADFSGASGPRRRPDRGGRAWHGRPGRRHGESPSYSDWGRLVSYVELIDHGLGRHARQRGLPKVGGVGDRAAGLRRPVDVRQDLLDGHGAGHGVGHRRLDGGVVPPSRVTGSGTRRPGGACSHRSRRVDVKPAQVRDAGGVDQRRRPRLEERAEGRPASPLSIRRGVSRPVEHTRTHVGLDGQENRAVIGAEGMSKVVDAGRIQSLLPATVTRHDHSHLDHPDQLHQVRGRLPNSVRIKEDALRCGGADALVGVDRLVAVLVPTAPARREGHEATGGRVHDQRAQRAETVTDGVDGDGRDPSLRQCGGDQEAVVLMSVLPWP